MPPQQQNLDSSNQQTPPPRFGPDPNPPTYPVSPSSNNEQGSDSPKKINKVWVIVLTVTVLIAILATATYFLLPNISKMMLVQPTEAAAQEYSPSIISLAKGSENWKNGKFEITGGHGLPTVTGTFIKTDSGQFYTVADVNTQLVTEKVQQLSQINPDHAAIYTSNEYQADALGLVNQVGYGLDKNILLFLNDLIKSLGADPSNSPEFTACENDLSNYFSKTGDYLGSLTPNYVYNEKYQSDQWSIDTTELFKNLSIKAQSPTCYQYLDKLLSSAVESDKLAGIQLIFEVTEESADGATFKMFVAPPVPSENYEFIFKMKISGVNVTATPTSYSSDPDTIFSRSSAFALTISQCGDLPVIAEVVNNTPVYIAPTSESYRGPQIRDLGYYCTATEAEADGYKAYTP